MKTNSPPFRLEALPYPIELHRHLDVSLRVSTLLELAIERGLVTSGTSLELFSNEFLLKTPVKNLTDCLSKFELYQKVLDRFDVLERVALEAVEDCVREGLGGVEFRFSPTFISQYSRIPWLEILDGFESGLNKAKLKFPKFKVGLIVIASRDAGMSGVEKTIDFFLQHPTHFIGFDLAGPESGFPPRQYRELFKPLIEANANITIHAGEGESPDNIWGAIEDLGAKRIGHGISIITDSALIREAIKRNICFEMCPTSNYITACVIELSKHPIAPLLRQGLAVTLNTDDPGIFGVTIQDEIRVSQSAIGLSTREITKCF